MKDFIAAGTGNSRYLKSALPDGTTWEQALEMLKSGTFPIDLNGINPAGVTQIGTPLNKATLLSDESAALFGLDENAVVDDVWELLSTANTLSTVMVTTEAGSRVTATKGSIVKYGTAINDVYLIRGLTPGSWTVTAEKGTDTASQIVVISDPQQYQVQLDYPRVYGVSWRFGTSSVMTRTDDAAGFAEPQPYVLGASTVYSPFDNIMPWAGMVRVTDEVCGELVAIPKFWYKLEYIVEEVGGVETNVGINIKISPTEQQGFHVSPAHMPRTSSDIERDVVYVGRYKCASDYKSKSGVSTVSCGGSPVSAIQSIESGKTYSYDYATWLTILMLYLVEFADWDSQKKIGAGGPSDSVSTSTGYTDGMPYHTGTMQQSRTVVGTGVQYRYVEGLWELKREYLQGLDIISASGSYWTRVSGRYNSLTGDTASRSACPDVSGYVVALAVFDDDDGAIFPVLIPSACGAEGRIDGVQWIYDPPVGTKDYADMTTGSAGNYYYTGGGYSSWDADNLAPDYAGISYLNSRSGWSASNNISCRLIKLP